MAKIIHLTPYYEPHLGGVEKHVREIAQIAKNNGDEVTIICQQHSQSLPLAERINGIHIIRIPVLKFHSKFFFLPIFDKLFFKLRLWTFIASKGQLLVAADIVQIHDVFWWIWPIYPLIYYKTFLTFHGWEGKFPIPWWIKLHRYYNWMAAKKTMHVGKFIQDFYWDKPADITYGGVTKSKIEENQNKKQPNNGLWIEKLSKVVFVGRLEMVNDIDKVIEFLRLLKDKKPKVQITFVGDGSWRTECEKLGRVTGLVADPSRYVLTADLVCANSYLSILESQAMGKLVLSFFGNKIKESYLKHFPGVKWMLVVENPHLLFVVLEKLTNKQHAILSHGARDYAQSQTWEKVYQQYLKLWSNENYKN